MPRLTASKTDPLVTTSYCLPLSLRSEVTRLCSDSGLTMAELTRSLLVKWIEDNAKKTVSATAPSQIESPKAKQALESFVVTRLTAKLQAQRDLIRTLTARARLASAMKDQAVYETSTTRLKDAHIYREALERDIYNIRIGNDKSDVRKLFVELGGMRELSGEPELDQGPEPEPDNVNTITSITSNQGASTTSQPTQPAPAPIQAPKRSLVPAATITAEDLAAFYEPDEQPVRAPTRLQVNRSKDEFDPSINILPPDPAPATGTNDEDDFLKQFEFK